MESELDTEILEDLANWDGDQDTTVPEALPEHLKPEAEAEAEAAESVGNRNKRVLENSTSSEIAPSRRARVAECAKTTVPRRRRPLPKKGVTHPPSLSADDRVKILALMEFPQQITVAKNSGNVSMFRRVMEKYLAEDCRLVQPFLTMVGRTHLGEVFNAINSSCPDNVSLIKSIKYHDRTIRVKMCFNMTKVFDHTADVLFDMALHPDHYPDLHAKAQAILARGKRYTIIGSKKLTLVPNETLDRIVTVYCVDGEVDIVEAADIEENDNSEIPL